MADSTIPSVPPDWTNKFSDALLGAGLDALKRATNPNGVTEDDTQTARTQAAWPWQKVVIIAAAVLGAALVIRLILKR